LAALPVLLAAVVVALAAWRSFGRGEVEAAMLAGIVSSMALALGVFGLAQQDLRSLKLSPRLAEAVHAAACPDPVVGTLGYREPSLVFLVGTKVVMLDNGRDAASFAAQGGCRILFVDSRHEALFQAALAERGVTAALRTRVAGFNINGGRRVDIGAYGVAP
jgi:hypothetical protein